MNTSVGSEQEKIDRLRNRAKEIRKQVFEHGEINHVVDLELRNDPKLYRALMIQIGDEANDSQEFGRLLVKRYPGAPVAKYAKYFLAFCSPMTDVTSQLLGVLSVLDDGQREEFVQTIYEFAWYGPEEWIERKQEEMAEVFFSCVDIASFAVKNPEIFDHPVYSKFHPDIFWLDRFHRFFGHNDFVRAWETIRQAAKGMAFPGRSRGLGQSMTRRWFWASSSLVRSMVRSLYLEVGLPSIVPWIEPKRFGNNGLPTAGFDVAYFSCLKDDGHSPDDGDPLAYDVSVEDERGRCDFVTEGKMALVLGRHFREIENAKRRERNARRAEASKKRK